ncbi:jg3576 [Pararge aegeria aegeria]|uniref:Jg3576 protein n=1 Tax=Pararge aegeria aegeria TaxID=348720 RepID=A0A8S4S6Y8_9NEOP|nr:jg3576 [Pararge aegeria aegeria]
MIQQPFLREKKEPIKVDISVKLIPKPRKKEKKRRESHIEEVVSPDRNKGVKNSISMEVTDRNVHILKETVEIVDAKDKECTESVVKDDINGAVLETFSEAKTSPNLQPDSVNVEDIVQENLNENLIIDNALHKNENLDLEINSDDSSKNAEAVNAIFIENEPDQHVEVKDDE